MTLKKALTLSVEHLLKCNLMQADLNTALVEDLKTMRERVLKLEALVDFQDERYAALLEKRKK